MTRPSRRMPPAPRGAATETLAGLTFPDPFRPLEDDRDAAVLAWQAAQAARTDDHVDGLPGVAELRARVAHHLSERTPAIPRYAGGRWFRAAAAPGTGHAGIVTAAEPFGDGRVVFAAAAHPDARGRTPVISWHSPSPHGRLLAVGLCYDGSEANTIRVVDVGTGAVLPDRPARTLQDNWTGGAQWLPDSSGFYYVAPDGPPGGFALRVFRHDLGGPSRATAEAVPLTPVPGLDYVAVSVSRDGRWAVAGQDLLRPEPVAVRDLSDPAGEWRPFVTGLGAVVAGHAVADEYVAVTDLGAPRGRLVAIPMTAPDAADPATWRVVVPESEAVLRSVTPVGDLLYLTELVDTYARVRVVARDGTVVGQVPLPGRGAVAEGNFPLTRMVLGGHPGEYLFGFSSLTASWGVYRHRPGTVTGTGTVETLAAPRVHLDAVVEDHWAVSPDGTRVPYHLVRRPDVAATARRPTLLYAYGGYGSPLVPQYPRSMAALVEAGGVFVHAHLRGGGEFGRDWWDGGRMANKPNCYADLFAVAEDLIAKGRTEPGRLAVAGGSNGGHMAGMAATRRPDLWRAVVARVPILDLLGACREPYGRAAVAAEIADPDDPDDVARLATISPYHLVEDGTAYPAVYLDVGATDVRCPAWHGRKFAARLQEATASDRPVLLRVWADVGHGWATARDLEVRQHTAWLAFVLDQLGLLPPP